MEHSRFDFWEIALFDRLHWYALSRNGVDHFKQSLQVGYVVKEQNYKEKQTLQIATIAAKEKGHVYENSLW